MKGSNEQYGVAERVANYALIELRWLKTNYALIELRWLKTSYALIELRWLKDSFL